MNGINRISLSLKYEFFQEFNGIISILSFHENRAQYGSEIFGESFTLSSYALSSHS